MSAPRVIVIGAGVAGVAAAWTAARHGANVTVLHARAGASAIYSGILDDAESGPVGPAELDADARAFVEALGVWSHGACTVATREGIARGAAGADRALLDLAPLAGKKVAVADVPRDDWDAPLVTESLNAGAWATSTGTQFVCVAAPILLYGHERRVVAHDFAALHDAPLRLETLAQVLRAAGAGFDGWLLGPWLGVVPGTAARLRQNLQVAVGETASTLGGAAGARFERARDALLAATAVEVLQGWAANVVRRGERWVVGFRAEAPTPDTRKELEASGIVLATGGVGAGGIVFADLGPGEHGFRLPFSAPVCVSLDGEPSVLGGSLYGPSLDVRGLGVLERVGIDADADGRTLDGPTPTPGLFAAGDAVAGRPRSVFAAVRSGSSAGRELARALGAAG